jgi:UDP-N-acetylglucosamine--N-acetylmuramyl-(pentapeptide) pyrophosphoryl-undecaprenol N-acetylglucosamine transferase
MIGYYVHHHGRGHLARATSVCAHLRSPVTLLSSIPLPEQPDAATVLLPRDDDASTSSDATANGVLHWAPLHDKGLRTRMRTIAEWVESARPDVVVVDVSVEVAMLIRLLGVPVIVMAMPGDRTDSPHDLVYRVADHIVAAWPRDLYEPRWLRQHSAKTTYVGGISRFDDRVRTPPSPESRANVLVLNGAGGADVDIQTVSDCAAAHLQFYWTSLGVAGGPWADDPWSALCAADVVISSAGQSSVADIAAARRPAVVVSAQRPFAEQRATARALDAAGLAVVRHDWPAIDEWPGLVEQAMAGDPDRWERWETRGAAPRAAEAIERVAAWRHPQETS